MTALNTSIVSVTPVVTASGIYASGDAVGGLLTFAGALLTDKGTGVILSVKVLDLASQDAALELVLFNQTFTPTADNAAFNPSDADMANCLGVVPIAAGDYATFANNSIATVPNVGQGVKAAGTKGVLYGQLVTRGTPTYVATSDITVTIVVLQD